MHGFLPTRGDDELIADLAKRQHGVVAHRQLRGRGIGRGAIEHRLRCGRIHRIHRGVYAVGHCVLGPDGHRMAAVLAAGPDAVLSGYSAAELWGLRVSSRPRHEVTVPRDVRLPSVDCHHARLPDDEITTVRGIPVTIVPRTILDLAAKRPQREVARLIHEAEVKRLWDTLSLWDLLARYPGRAGTRVIRAALAERDHGVPRNVFEDAFLAFIDRYGLPRPETNVWLQVGKRSYEIDCLWREKHLVVELDGRGAHDTARAFENDREKDRRLRVAGWDPIRVTWRMLEEQPSQLAEDLGGLLR
jgi:Transcriptional regulator, AbiEi antitoxin